MRKRKYVSLGDTQNMQHDYDVQDLDKKYEMKLFPVPQCHNIVSTSQIQSSQGHINLQRLADLFPFTSYDRKRFAAITIRLANPHCTCLLFGSGKLVITGSTSFNACIVAAHEITRILRVANPRHWFEVISCVIQNIVAHVELAAGTTIDLERLYNAHCECSTYQRSIFPGLVFRPPRSPIVLLVFTSGRIVCTGGRSYDDIYYGFAQMYDTLQKYIVVQLPLITTLISSKNKRRLVLSHKTNA
jgi:transcription initiation factor TFIID TATA-box-binding protein